MWNTTDCEEEENPRNVGSRVVVTPRTHSEEGWAGCTASVALVF